MIVITNFPQSKILKLVSSKTFLTNGKLNLGNKNDLKSIKNKGLNPYAYLENLRIYSKKTSMMLIQAKFSLIY